MQLKGFCAIKRGRFLFQGPRFPLQALRFPSRIENFQARMKISSGPPTKAFFLWGILIGDKFGESLGGSQATPSFWEVPGLPRKFPKLPRKFFGDFPGSSLTVELYSNPGVPRKFPGLPRRFPGLPRRFPGLPRRSAPFSGKPDTLS